MSTEAQRAANRANAQHSTGPRSEAGKAQSAINHFRHGLTGRFTFIPGESPSEYQSLLAALTDEHQPGTPTETILIDRLAQHYWLTQRALRLQNLCLEPETDLSPADLPLYLRYQVTHERAFSRTLNDLLKLRRERRQAEKVAAQQALAEQKWQIGFERLRDAKAAHERADLRDRPHLSPAELERHLREIDLPTAQHYQKQELLAPTA